MTWPVVPLRDLTCLADSGTWGDEAPEGAGFPVLRSSNIQGGRLDLSEVAWRLIPEADIARRLLESGDLLITKSSGSPDLIGKCCQFTQPEGGTKFYFSNFTLRLRADHNRADSRWLFFWLSSPRGRAVLAAMNTTTSGLRNLNIGFYLSQLVPAPPVTEQRRIAAILDKADTIRRKRQQAIQFADNLLRSAFLDMFGDPITNPHRWRSIKLGALLASRPQIGTITPAADVGEHRVVRVGELGEFEVNLEHCLSVDLPSDQAEKHRLVEDDFLLTRAIGSEDHLGKASVFQGSAEPMVFDSHVMRLRLDPRRLQPIFLWQWLRTPGGRQLMMRRARQTAVQFNINAEQASNIDIPLPPFEVQEQFSRLFLAVRGFRHHVEHLEAEDSQLFASLVQRAFRGEL